MTDIINEGTKITVKNIEEIKKYIQDQVTEAKKYASSRHFISSLNFVEKEYKQDDISFNKGVIYAEPNTDNMEMDSQFYNKQIRYVINRDAEAYQPYITCNGLKYYMFEIVRESNILNNSEEGKLADIINKGTKITEKEIETIEGKNIKVETINKIKEYIRGKVKEYKEKYTCPKSFCSKTEGIKITDEDDRDGIKVFNVHLADKDITQLLIKNGVATEDGFVEKIEISRITEIIGGITNEIEKQKANNDLVNQLLNITKSGPKTEPKPPINDNDQNNNKLLLNAINGLLKGSFNFYFFDKNLFIQPKNETGKKNVIKIGIENIKAENIDSEIKKAIKKINDNPDKVSIHAKNAEELAKELKELSLSETDNKISNNGPDKWKRVIEGNNKPKKYGNNIQK